MRIERLILPNAQALDEIAKAIWQFAQETEQRPQVVLSTSGPANALRRAMERLRPKNLPKEIVFLPKILGLAKWLEQTPSLMDYPAVLSTLERWEKVQQALIKYPLIQKNFGVIGEKGIWSLTKSIVQACDHLSQAHLNIDPSLATVFEYDQAKKIFDKALAAAYPLQQNDFIQEESALIMAFWKNLSSLQDPVIRRQCSLMLRTQMITQVAHLEPLVWIEMGEVRGSQQLTEEHFLDRYADRQSVLKIGLDWERAALWPECLTSSGERPEKHLQIQKNRQDANTEHIRIIALPNFEKMAWGALACIQEHIAQDRRRIALVAQDRLVARRVRALLNRLGSAVVVQDQTGWKLSTTGAAAAVQSWLEIARAREGPDLHQLLGFIKNPLLDWSVLWQNLKKDSVDFEQVCWFIEKTILERRFIPNWQSLLEIFYHLENQHEPFDDLATGFFSHQNNTQLSIQLLQNIQELAQAWQGGFKTGKDWVLLLQEQLQHLGMTKNLSSDAAGADTMQALQEMQRMQTELISGSSWFSLFDQWMEESSYLEQSPLGYIQVSIIPLAATRLQVYDAVVMVGCDDRQLPNLTDHGLIFSKAMVASLGLATMEDQYQQYARDLSALIQAHPHTDFLWQEWQQAQERNRCAGWLTRLQFELGHLANKKITLPQSSTLLGGQTTAKASLQIGDTLFPKRISPSSYKTLRECPYRFYATRLLGLWAPSALQSSSEFGMVGNVLHAILARFYRQLKIQDVSNLQVDQAEYDRPQWMYQQLQRISNQQWQPLIEHDGKLLGMRQEWLDQIPHWIHWQIEQEANGWEFASAEVPVTFQLDLVDGTQLEIAGRADRFDTHATLGTARVIDYKFQAIKKIIDKERFIEDDPQLLIYAQGANGTSVVHGQPITIGAWCSLKSLDNLERVHDIEINADMTAHLIDQMQEDLGAIWQGAPMPASGPEQVCRYCDVRGICRKGMWLER